MDERSGCYRPHSVQDCSRRLVAKTRQWIVRWLRSPFFVCHSLPVVGISIMKKVSFNYESMNKMAINELDYKGFF